MNNGNISIRESLSSNEQRIFLVDFFGTTFITTVTSTPSVVRKWIRSIWFSYREYRDRLIVGLGVQWNPYTSDSVPAGTLQLCVGTRCLIVQLAQADSVPQLLRRFLEDPNTKFVGIWNHSDAYRLRRSEFEFEFSSDPIDLRYSAAEWEEEPWLERASMETLVSEVLGFEGVTKDEDVSKSDWNAYWLSHEQVLYASVDAYVSFLMGKRMSRLIQSNNISSSDSSSSSYY